MVSAPQPRHGEQFLHKQDSNLHRSTAVELEQMRRARTQHDEDYIVGTEHEPREFRVNDEKPETYEPHHGLGSEVHTKPAEKIEDWMAVLRRTHEGHRDDPRVLERIKNSYHKRYVISEDTIPEAAYQLEARIARNMGYGDIPITDQYRHEKAREIIAGQEESLDRWVDYLSSEDATYPMWLKYWAFTSATKMGKFEKKIDEEGRETARFARRTEDTVAPFPPLNPRALALTLSAIEAKAAQVGIPKQDRELPENTSTKLKDSAFQQLLATESFSKLYTQFLIELPAYSAEGLRETRGAWKKYDQGSDAQPLVDSLQGHPLEWCTAGIEVARPQLANGDFYVYYSLDEDGEPTIPRVAIRMENERIAEVRGIAPDQELDPYISDVVAEKMQEFPDGEEYAHKAEDMKRLTEIDERVQRGMELPAEDLRFLYEIDKEIEGFGYDSDPRIDELISNRDFITDMEVIFNIDGQAQIIQKLMTHGKGDIVANHINSFTIIDHNQIAYDLIVGGYGRYVAQNLDKITGLDAQIAHELIVAGMGQSVGKNLNKFPEVDHNQIAHELIAAGDGSVVAYYIDKFIGIDQAQLVHELIAVEGDTVALNLEKFTGLDHNQIAHEFIAAGKGDIVVYQLHKFTDLNHNQIVHELIAAGQGYAVANNIRKFTDLDHSQIAHELIAAGDGEPVARNLNEFTGLDHNQIVHELIAGGQGDAVANNLLKFTGVDHNQIAHELIAAGLGDAVSLRLHYFRGLDEGVYTQLRQLGFNV